MAKAIQLKGLRVWKVTVRNSPDGLSFDTYTVAGDNAEKAIAKVRSLSKRRELKTIVSAEQIAVLDR